MVRIRRSNYVLCIYRWLNDLKHSCTFCRGYNVIWLLWRHFPSGNQSVMYSLVMIFFSCCFYHYMRFIQEIGCRMCEFFIPLWYFENVTAIHCFYFHVREIIHVPSLWISHFFTKSTSLVCKKQTYLSESWISISKCFEWP